MGFWGLIMVVAAGAGGAGGGPGGTGIWTSVGGGGPGGTGTGVGGGGPWVKTGTPPVPGESGRFGESLGVLPAVGFIVITFLALRSRAL